jgi:hypothetical protein
MQNVPHWQWFMVIYFLAVAIPVYLAHVQLKKKLLVNKTGRNVVFYFLAVAATAFTMHFLTMLVYFKFIFSI